jgi:hypothetical protein
MKLCWAQNLLRVVEASNAYTILVGNSLGKLPVGRPSSRRQDYIKMDFMEIGCGGGEWMELVEDRVELWAVLNLQFLLLDS